MGSTYFSYPIKSYNSYHYFTDQTRGSASIYENHGWSCKVWRFCISKGIYLIFLHSISLLHISSGQYYYIYSAPSLLACAHPFQRQSNMEYPQKFFYV